MGDSNTNGRHKGQGFVLPPITAMTQGLPSQALPERIHPQQYETRDSGNWSAQQQSKPDSSSVSSNPSGLHLQTILNSDDTPSRYSGQPGTPQSARYPSQTHLSQQNIILPALNHSYDHRGSMASIDARETSFLDSRRSSVDSRSGQNLNHLNLNQEKSSWDITNASQGALVSSLQQQRGIAPMSIRSNGSQPLSPLDRRGSSRSGPVVKRAPPIVSNPRSSGMPDPMASTPTRGYAWAFPDRPWSDDPIRPGEPDDLEDSSPDSSRQPSITASSIHTMDSAAYSARQSRYGDDGMHSQPDMHGTHHKGVASLQGGMPGSMSSGNYSRTPELRVSHKMAERKRRSEMKDLFDTLNRTLPNSPGNKSSKWEILSKAIEYIQNLKSAFDASQRDITKMRDEIEHARAAAEENRHLQNEITAMYQQLLRVDPSGHHVFGPRTQFLENQESQTPNRLAPLQPPQASYPQGGAMQGVEYDLPTPYIRRLN